jgi:hypothetical protein
VLHVVEAVHQRHGSSTCPSPLARPCATVSPGVDAEAYRFRSTGIGRIAVAEGDVLSNTTEPSKSRRGQLLKASGRSSTSIGTSSTWTMQALARGHGALHHRILHGQRADRVEEALDVEQERDHHADVEALRPSTI